MHGSLRATGAISLLFVAFAAWSAEPRRDAGDLDEIVVTATLRDRELRELPASATVLDSRTLQNAGVQHFADVLSLVPNLNWSAGTSRPRFFQLRGIGELSQWQGAPNPSVGFLIDDIDFSGVGMPAMLHDVDRIEVLRGPQGTVYGANALAGLIAVNTRAARREDDLDANVTFGDHGTYGANGVLGGALGGEEKEGAWRLVAGRYRSDGFRRNSFLGRDDTNGYDETSARLKLHARPLEHLTTDVTAMWADLDNGYDAFSIDNSRTTLSDKPGEDTQIARALALRVTYDGAATFDIVNRTSAGASRSVYSFDGDWGNDDSWAPTGYVPYDYFQRFDRERRTLSNDLRLVSRQSIAGGATVAWLAGVYALRTDEDVRQTDTYRDLYYGAGQDITTSDFRATNLAAYGEVEWRLAPATVLAVGVRGERRAADYSDSDGSSFSPDETMFGGSLSLRRDLGERSAAYVTLARGYKAGGFNIGDEIPADRRYYDAEILHSLELGFRSANVAGTVEGEAALFYMRRRDQQVQTGVQLVPNDPLTFFHYTDNAAGGENYGLEGSLRFRPVESLLFDLRAAILETRYLDYFTGERDLDGREQAHAPGYQFDLGIEWRGAPGWFARVDLAGLDDFYFDDSHDERAAARVLTHVKAGYSGKHWRAEVWIRNLFDEYYAQRGFWFGNEPPDFPATRYVQAGDPRHAGVTVAYSFR